MSTLLEQAIVDAKSLKEAALKNAEHALLEKYSEEMKSAVETLLEAEGDEDPLADMGGMGEEEEVEDTLPDVPAAVTDGEDLCPCPDTDEEINIDFDQLKAAVDAEEASLDDGGMMDRDEGDLFGDDDLELGGEEEDVLELQEVFMLEEEDKEKPEEEDKEELDEGSCGDYKRDDEELEEEIELEEADEEDEEDMLDEAALRDMIKEMLHVDHTPQPAGTLGGYGYTNDAEIEEEVNANLAAMRDSARAEEIKERDKRIKDLQESVRKHKTKTKRYAQAVNTLKEKLDEMALSNAKLLYTNKVLNSDSLNERQSKKIVEAISNANSVNEAKVIYETLQSTVGSVAQKQQPKSLSEAVSRKPAFLPRREPKPAPSSEMTRWHVLAGLGDKK